MDSGVIAGIDEAGRGALAGPIVAGACILTRELYRRRRAFPCWSPFRRRREEEVPIADSKLLTSEERECSYAWITEHCHWGVGIVSHRVIDECGILAANQRAMLLALQDLCTRCRPLSLLIDGRDHFRFPIPHTSIIDGDRLYPCIAAGSIVAKVTRDRLMRFYSPEFPLYNFAQHKGYGTDGHITLIREHGPCALHRRSFLRALLENQELPLVLAA